MQISLIRCVYFGTLQASSDTFISHFIFWPQFTITKTHPMFYPYNIWSCIRLIIFRSYYKWRRWLLFININLVKLWSEPPEFFHFVASFMQMTEVVRVSTVGPSGLQNRLEPLDTQWGFSNLLSCSQMLVNLPALFLFALSSCPRALWLSGSGSARTQAGEPASTSPQLQLETSSLGIGLAIYPWSLRLFSQLPFLRLTPDRAFLSSSPHLSFRSLSSLFPSLQPPSPARSMAPQGVRGNERPSVASGLAVVPRLFFEEKVTAAAFRRLLEIPALIRLSQLLQVNQRKFCLYHKHSAEI